MYQINQAKLTTNSFFLNSKKARVIKTIVRNIDCSRIKPQRAGVVLYTKQNGVINFIFGVDSRSSELTDFGGTVEYSKLGETVIDGALREFEEETLDIFTKLTKEDIVDCLTIYDDNNLIIFVPIKEDFNQVTDIFDCQFEEIRKTQKDMPEVRQIKELSMKELTQALNTPGVIFDRVRKFISAAGDPIKLLPQYQSNN